MATRTVTEPIGPSSSLIDLDRFVTEADRVRKHARFVVDTGLWDPQGEDDTGRDEFPDFRELENLGPEGLEELERRCSLPATLTKDLATISSDENIMSELREWQLSTYTKDMQQEEGSVPFRKSSTEEPVDEGEREADGEEPRAEAPPTKRRKKDKGKRKSVGRGDDEGGRREDEAGAEIAEAGDVAVPAPPPNPVLEAILKYLETTELKMIPPGDEVRYYLRKTKTSDYNILSDLRPSDLGRPLGPPNGTSPPSSQLLISITLHPVPRMQNRTTFTPNLQRIHLLGSSTLADLRDSISCIGDSMPELLPEDVVIREEEDDVALVGGIRVGLGAGEVGKRVRYGGERRKAGSCFLMEGLIFWDDRDGVRDYGEMIIESVNRTIWPGTTTPYEPAQARQTTTTGEEGEEDEDRMPGIQVESSTRDAEATATDATTPGPAGGGGGSRENEAQQGDRGGPDIRKGSGFSETRLGDLKLRKGKAYWFLHQGNCEHVWSVDDVRLIHPSDPQSPTSYPITSFISRHVTPKCKICDRDPAVMATINDELAGETPCLMCKVCFEMLHGDEGGEGEGEGEEGGRGYDVVPILPEK